MTTTRPLLVLALSCWLSAPALAQSAIEPADATMPAAEAAPLGDSAEPAPAAEPTPALEPMPVPEPQPAPAPLAVPAPEAVPAAPQAVPAPSPMPAAPAAEPAEESEEGLGGCAMTQLCVGPVLSLGLINPLGLGAHARYGEHLGFAIDYQFIPTLSFGDASAGWSLLTLEARWYPSGGAFWLGGGFGYQNFSADAQATDAVTGLTARVEGSVGVPALKLGLGFMGHDGFIMGIDLGFNVPIGSTNVDFSGAVGSDEQVAQLKAEVQEKADAGIGLLPFIPQVNLLRIGYLF